MRLDCLINEVLERLLETENEIFSQISNKVDKKWDKALLLQ